MKYNNLKYLKTIFAIFTIFSLAIYGGEVYAQQDGLVACKDIGACDFCDLVRTVKNVVDFMIFQVAPFIAVMMVLYGGIMMMISGGDQKKYSDAKNILIAAFVGVLIILSAWFVVNTIIVGLISGGDFESLKGNWWKIQC